MNRRFNELNNASPYEVANFDRRTVLNFSVPKFLLLNPFNYFRQKGFETWNPFLILRSCWLRDLTGSGDGNAVISAKSYLRLEAFWITLAVG